MRMEEQERLTSSGEPFLPPILLSSFSNHEKRSETIFECYAQNQQSNQNPQRVARAARYWN